MNFRRKTAGGGPDRGTRRPDESYPIRARTATSDHLPDETEFPFPTGRRDAVHDGDDYLVGAAVPAELWPAWTDSGRWDLGAEPTRKGVRRAV